MKRILKHGLIAAALISLPALAIAGGNHGDRAARRAEKIAQFDSNNDGTLDQTERQAMKEARKAARMAKLDGNGDGTVDDAERQAARAARQAKHQARHEARFAAIDTNNDSYISKEEWKAAAKHMKRGGKHKRGHRSAR